MSSVMPPLELPDFDIRSADLVATAQLLLSRKPQLEKLAYRKRCEVSGLRSHGFTIFDDAERALSRINSTAGTLLKQAVAIKQDDNLALKLLAELYRQRGEHESALACDRMAMASQSQDKGAKISAAKSLLAMGRFDDAIDVTAVATGIARDRLECIRLVPFKDWGERISSQAKVVGNAEPFAQRLTCVIDGKTVLVDQTVEQIALTVVHAQDLTVIDGFIPKKNDTGYVWDYGVADILASRSEAAWETAFIHNTNTDTRIIDEPCIYIGGVAWLYRNYYHVLAQNFPRLALLLDMPEFADFRIAIPATIRPWGLEILQEMGVSAERVVLLDTRQNALLRHGVVSVIRHVVGKDEIRALRRRLGVNARQQGTRRFFVGRRTLRSHGRLLINEVEIASIAAEYGFEEIEPGGMSIRQQIELFGQTAAICGPGGAAFGNIVYAPDNAAVICMTPREVVGTWYPYLAGVCNQPFYWCFGNFLPEGSSSRSIPAMPFFINPGDFRRILEIAVGNGKP